MEPKPLIDPAEMKNRRQAAFLSLFVGLFLMLAKFWAHNLTGSQAIYSDAMESIVNVTAALMVLFVIYYSIKPVDEDHPYGHGKSEFFSSAFEGGLITFASIMIVVEAVQVWIEGVTLERLGEGIVIVAAAGLINLALGIFLKFRGRRGNSIALTASGMHVIADFWTSVAMILSLFLVTWTQWTWLDPFVAIVFGLWLGWTGLCLIRHSIDALMDREDPTVLRSLVKVFTDSMQPGIIQIHHVRVIRSGWFHHIDAHAVMPEFWDVKKVHSTLDQFEKKAIENYEYEGEMNFHVDPCRQAYCEVCELENCPIRLKEFKQSMRVNIEDIRSPVEPVEFRRNREGDD